MTEPIEVIDAQAAQDGAGVNIHRLAGASLHKTLNPFLMIDEINSNNAADYIGGFPEHPHRGFETITYMKAGRMRHRDHMNNEGVISAGDVQWMTAGAGVLHSEMPEQQQGLLHGFQIWLNLPAAKKMQPAAYREIASNDIPEQALADGGKVRFIAGKATINQQTGQGYIPNASMQAVLLDVQLAPNESIDIELDSHNGALAYVYRGATTAIASRQLGVYRHSKSLKLTSGPQGAELLLLSGQTITEPIIQYGPFVMNTHAEIQTAIKDFQNPNFLKQPRK